MLNFRVYKLFKKFVHFEDLPESDFDEVDLQRFDLLIQCVNILAKAGRLDVISKYHKIKEFRQQFDKDKVGLELLQKVEVLIEAIENYQIGKWESAIKKYIKFLQNNHEVLSLAEI